MKLWWSNPPQVPHPIHTNKWCTHHTAMTSLLYIICNTIQYTPGFLNLSLEGQSAAEFSSKPWSNSPTCDFLMILKTLISMLRCVWLGLELKLCRNGTDLRMPDIHNMLFILCYTMTTATEWIVLVSCSAVWKALQWNQKWFLQSHIHLNVLLGFNIIRFSLSSLPRWLFKCESNINVIFI